MLSEVREQDEGVRYLRKVITGQLTSPLLLVGDEGIGRRYSVVQAVKEAFSGGDPESRACFQVDQKIHPDFCLLVPEGDKEIGVEAVREIIQKAYDFPMFASKRYIAIDGADRMTVAAANAFLKTLEEPPKRTQFFLLAESADSVIPTIRSRCGKIRYKRLSETFISESLHEFVPEATKALVYARLAEGSLGRAFQYYGSNRLDLRDRALGLLKIGLAGDLSSLFLAVDSFEKNLALGLRFFEHVLYDLTMLPYAPDRITNLDLAAELRVVGKQLGPNRLRALQQTLRVIQGRMRQTKVNLQFHVKAGLASAFSE